MADTLTIAISKGRVLQEALPLLAQLGIVPLEDPEQSRRLILQTSQADVRLVLVRAADVPTYVEHGTAELGIAGKDVLLEYECDGLYEPLDLGIARCRMVVAGPKQTRKVRGRARIATKYVRTARAYFADQGEQVEIIRLYGSMEIAPGLGLADRIVDLVDSGRTLAANNLEILETIAEISSRLIVNKAAMKMKGGVIRPFIRRLAEVVRK
ncbi:MAG: ATP phosphoribosyltransferase [Gammaproteobacteria bacterium RIFCSPLOWO2_02_FULL_61_13]|nr:MAG: ATP phosphoribosyltransferase [Gammaproteobacteria bacterium RIFCSPLOWO2_02_FULL_61_13]